MTTVKNHIYNRAGKKPILLDYYIPENGKNCPIIIFAHGYKGFKDWGAWSLMGKEFANAGFCFVKFNFSHNGGTMEAPIDFPDLEAFGNNNYTIELDDLGDMIDWTVQNLKNLSKVDTSEIFLIGHSRGGGISILKTANDSRVKKLITIASVSDFGGRSSTIGDLEQWKKDGVKYVTNGRTQQEMPHYIQFYEDYVQNEKRLNIKTACENINIPHLILHGSADSSISTQEAHKIHKWNLNSELKIIKGANHVFNVKHPWTKDGIPKEFEEMIFESIRFLKQKTDQD